MEDYDEDAILYRASVMMVTYHYVPEVNSGGHMLTIKMPDEEPGQSEDCRIECSKYAVPDKRELGQEVL